MDKRQRYCWPALLLTLTLTPSTDMSVIARLMLSCVQLALVPLILVDACVMLDAFQGVSIEHVYLRLLGARMLTFRIGGHKVVRTFQCTCHALLYELI